MTFQHIHREEARAVGEPDDATVAELAGVAPPCSECGQREGTEARGGRRYCYECCPDGVGRGDA
jgi:hypothetical protein